MDVSRGQPSPLARPLDEIAWADLEALRTHGFGSGTGVLLHGPLVFGPRDPETDDAGRAFDALLADVVALANAGGGDLLVGSDAGPGPTPRIRAWRTVGDCRRAAAHVERLARERIEPRIPRLQVRGIARTGGTDGALLLRVPRSRLAPHRLDPGGEIYVREGGRTRVLAVREAQEIAFRIARETARVESRLDELRRRGGVLTSGALPRLRDAHAVRASAAPASAIEIPREWLWNRREPFVADGAETALPWRRRPVLGGLSWRFGARPERARVEMFTDGAVSFWAVGGTDRAPEALATTLARATIALVDALRASVDRPRLEYALEVELYAGTDANDGRLPLYSLGEPGRSAIVLDLLAADLDARARRRARRATVPGAGPVARESGAAARGASEPAVAGGAARDGERAESGTHSGPAALAATARR